MIIFKIKKKVFNISKIMEKNSQVHRISLYSDIDMYNKSSQLGPELPPTVPSQMFPTFLEQKTNNSYDILTYNNSLYNYPSVNTAYPFEEPKYFVGKSPENKIIREFKFENMKETTTPTPIPKNCQIENEPIREGFTVSDLKELDIVLFYDKKCPFSREQMKQSFVDQLHLKDVKKRENKQMLTNINGTSVPMFYSLKTNRKYTGLEKNPKNLYKNLSSRETFLSPQQQKCKDLDIVIYSSKSCPYCVKLNEMLQENQMLDYVTVIDDTSQMRNLSSIQGFPYSFSKKTNKNMTGAPNSVELLIDRLSDDGRTSL